MNHYQVMQTDTPQQASEAQQETHQTTYKPQIPALPQETNYAMQTAMLQQAEHHFQKQKKAWTAMTMTTGYPGKQSEQEARKEHAQNHKSANNEKE
jgi:hypothetical protein